MKTTPVIRFAAQVAVGYVLVSALWIAFSDQWLANLVMDEHTRSWIATVKAWLFVLATGGLLFALMRRGFSRFQAEAVAREATQSALQESEERFRFVVENIREVFWIREVGEPRRFVYVSPNYETEWGFSREQLLANPMCLVGNIHPDDRARLLDAVEKKQVLGTYDEQYRLTRPDGSMRWIRDRAFPVRGSDGMVKRIVGMAEDITERKALEDQFLRAQRMEAVGTLAGGIAHDLNNILAPMLMAAGLLKEKISDPHDREMITMVEKSARRGAEIIRQLLMFSRGVSGARMPLDVRHLIKEMAALVRETFPREIQLVEDAPSQLWPVVADATQTHQVLVNLCVNARDAMPGGGRLTLAAENVMLDQSDVLAHRGTRPGPHVLMTVTDTGMGIPPAIIGRIFDPFFTTKEIGKGTGLGLSTVLGIVRSHGGFIDVQSTAGAGSTFKVYLPAEPSEQMDAGSVSAEPFPIGHGELILVVDDEEAIREATRHVLEKHNYRVITASDGKEAVTRFLAERHNVRLVLTDVMMPEMGGAALVRALRLINPRMKVVAVSGLDPEGKHAELSVLGVTEVLPKPCSSNALLGAVERALAKAEEEEES